MVNKSSMKTIIITNKENINLKSNKIIGVVNMTMLYQDTNDRDITCMTTYSFWWI